MPGTAPCSVSSNGGERTGRFTVPPTSRRQFMAPTYPDISDYPELAQEYYRDNRETSAIYMAESRLREEWNAQHCFYPMAGLCVDGRVQDFWEAIGLPFGLTEIFRSAGAKKDFTSLNFGKRVLQRLRDLKELKDGRIRPMVGMYMLTVHHSVGDPHESSCARWRHRTNQALVGMRRRANDMNMSFSGRVVALPVMIDTDLDAITIVPDEGKTPLNVRDLINRPEMIGDPMGFLVSRLSAMFPSAWLPLSRLEPEYREAFHRELAEYVLANWHFVQKVINSHRPIELLDHQERRIVIGRDIDTRSKHNEDFLIDDDNPALLADFLIGLKYVTRRTVLEAVRENNHNWVVPVLCNVPHDGDDMTVTHIYTRGLESRLRQKMKTAPSIVTKWLLENAKHALPDAARLTWVVDGLADLENRVFICKSVSSRSNRLFEPFQ